MMEKIKLSNSCKKILLKIKNEQYTHSPQSDKEDLLFLEHEGLVDVVWTEFGNVIIAKLSEKGIAYLRINPKLKDPSIFEDKKYWITTIISVIVVIIAIIELFKD